MSINAIPRQLILRCGLAIPAVTPALFAVTRNARLLVDALYINTQTASSCLLLTQSQHFGAFSVADHLQQKLLILLGPGPQALDRNLRVVRSRNIALHAVAE